MFGVRVEDISIGPPVRSGRRGEGGKDPDDGLDGGTKLGKLVCRGEEDIPLPPVACRPKRGDGSGDSEGPAVEKDVVA